jgi:hypothetical protein
MEVMDKVRLVLESGDFYMSSDPIEDAEMVISAEGEKDEEN